MWRPAILQRVEAALLDEKAAKLLGLARVLDQMLGPGFDADGAALRTRTDEVAAAFPSVGLGYYDAALDQIVAYAPSAELGYLVGVTPPADHLGRVAMRERCDKVAVGSMVRGDALNCMHPLVREGRVIGFTFANESLEDIYQQTQAGNSRLGPSTETEAVLGLAGLTLFAGESALSAARLRTALTDAAARLPVDPAEARRLVRDLEQVERYMQLFLHNLQVGVLVVDGAGTVTFLNRSAALLTGRAAEEALGRPWQAVLAGLEAAPALASAMAAPGGRHLPLQTILRRPDGTTAALAVMAAALPESDDWLILLEETERSRRQDEYFERAERLALAGELATAIAHEVRNPLTVVAGSIQLIPQRLCDEEFLLSLSRIAGEELARVNRIIAGLLGFARYSEPQMAPLDLNERVHQAVEFIRAYAAKAGVTILTHLQPGPLQVYGDGEHLQQALLNLMMNGIQAMAQGGRLTVTTEHPGSSRLVRLAVADEGSGIAPDELERIWQVFYSSKAGGTGLGLPVVQRIVDEHHGYIEVETAPGKGTCFTVLLPVSTGSDFRDGGGIAGAAPSGGR